MTTEKMQDLTFQQFSDGTVRLEQSSGLDDPAIVDLHPSQLRHVAEAVGLMEPSKLPDQPRALKKRLERIHDRLADIHDDLAAVPIYPPGSGSSADDPEVRSLWDAITALEDLLDDYFAEDGVDPEDPQRTEGQRSAEQTGGV